MSRRSRDLYARWTLPNSFFGLQGRIEIWYSEPRTGLIENKTKIYYGLTSTTFKTRYANHKTSFRLAAYRTNTTLSAHIWRLKDLSINNYNLKFSIVKLAKPYSREAKSCELCLQEKTFILFSDHYETLNRRSEILYKCVHRAGHLLDKWWSFLSWLKRSPLLWKEISKMFVENN